MNSTPRASSLQAARMIRDTLVLAAAVLAILGATTRG
jgi:hypothetical protein